jgi:hypothetical protein
MKLNFDVIISLVFLTGYCYAIVTEHIPKIGIDKKISVPQQPDGAIMLKAITVSGLIAESGSKIQHFG